MYAYVEVYAIVLGLHELCTSRVSWFMTWPNWRHSTLIEMQSYKKFDNDVPFIVEYVPIIILTGFGRIHCNKMWQSFVWQGWKGLTQRMNASRWRAGIRGIIDFGSNVLVIGFLSQSGIPPFLPFGRIIEIAVLGTKGEWFRPKFTPIATIAFALGRMRASAIHWIIHWMIDLLHSNCHTQILEIFWIFGTVKKYHDVEKESCLVKLKSYIVHHTDGLFNQEPMIAVPGACNGTDQCPLHPWPTLI